MDGRAKKGLRVHPFLPENIKNSFASRFSGRSNPRYAQRTQQEGGFHEPPPVVIGRNPHRCGPPYSLEKIKVPLVPPNPKLLDRTYFNSAGCAF